MKDILVIKYGGEHVFSHYTKWNTCMFTMTQKTQKLLPKGIIDFLAIKRVGGELEL